MPGAPGLVETAGWVAGLAGVSWLTFASVSFLEVKKKYEGTELWDPAPLPPPSKAPPPPAPVRAPQSGGKAAAPRGFGSKGAQAAPRK
jgi:hypothetical protein